MNINRQKIVDFARCTQCKHFLTDESEEPCRSCLQFATNTASSRPVNFKEKENQNERKKKQGASKQSEKSNYNYYKSLNKKFSTMFKEVFENERKNQCCQKALERPEESN